MKIDKILFIGLGGAGQRHLRIFHALHNDRVQYTGYRQTNKTPLLNSDFTVNPNQEITDLYPIQISGNLDELLSKKPDLTVISTPTSQHFELVMKAVRNKSHVLVEKPFSHQLSGAEEAFSIAQQNNLRLFTSFQRRFNPPFQKIKELLVNNNTKVFSAHFNVFSHVPDWHKYENFKELYAVKKELGGGVLLTEIHEIDLCCWFFGLPQAVYCSGGNLSYEKLDVEDTASMILHYPNFNVTFSMSFMAKATERNFSIKTFDGEIKWDEKQSSGDFTMNDMFKEQARSISEASSSFSKDDEFNAIASLKVVDAAKKSMLSGKKESLL